MNLLLCVLRRISAFARLFWIKYQDIFVDIFAEDLGEKTVFSSNGEPALFQYTLGANVVFGNVSV